MLLPSWSVSWHLQAARAERYTNTRTETGAAGKGSARVAATGYAQALACRSRGYRRQRVSQGQRAAFVAATLLASPLFVIAPCALATIGSLLDCNGYPNSSATTSCGQIQWGDTPPWDSGSEDVLQAYSCAEGHTGAVEPSSDLATQCLEGFQGYAIFECNEATASFEQTASCEPVVCNGNKSAMQAIGAPNVYFHSDYPEWGVTASFNSSTGDPASFSGFINWTMLSFEPEAVPFGSSLTLGCNPGYSGQVIYTCSQSGSFTVSSDGCTACAPGTFRSYDDAFDGEFLSPAATSSCTECQPGRYADTSNSTNCVTCSPGTFTSSSTIPCSTCTPGSFTDALASDSAVSCTPCAAGQYSANSTTQCVPCEAGQFQSSPGQATCQNCSVGLQAPADGSAACEDIDECEAEQQPCQNEGVCHNIVGGYVCMCVGSTSGDECEIISEECPEPNHCDTANGTCTVNIDFALGYVCACNPLFEAVPGTEQGTECVAADDMYADAQMVVTPPPGTSIDVQCFSTSSAQASVTILSNGTTDLYIQKAEVVAGSPLHVVAWATVFVGLPGDVPPYEQPLSPGETWELGVAFQGVSTDGVGQYSGQLRLYTNVPNTFSCDENPSDSLPDCVDAIIVIDLTVQETMLVVVAQPSGLATLDAAPAVPALSPGYPQTHMLTVWNVVTENVTWQILECSCDPEPCHVESWIQFETCGWTQAAQSALSIPVTFVSPSVAGEYHHVIRLYIPEVPQATWSVDASLTVITSAELFNATRSTYELGSSPCSQSGSSACCLDSPEDGLFFPGVEHFVALCPRDHWGNDIATSSQICNEEANSEGDCKLMVLNIDADAAGIDGRRLQSGDIYGNILDEQHLEYNVATGQVRASFTRARNGTFGLALRFQDDEWISPHDAIPNITISALLCDQGFSQADAAQAYPNSEGNLCLLYHCTAGHKLADGNTTCSKCLPGQYSITPAIHCIHCPAGQYCSDDACDSCSNCAPGQFSTGESPTVQCDYCVAGRSTPYDMSGMVDGSTVERPDGAIECVDCPGGTYSSDGLDCIECPPGKHSSNVDPSSNSGMLNAMCDTCPHGQQPVEDGTYDPICETIFMYCSMRYQGCTLCPAGKSASDATFGTCEECTEDKVSSDDLLECKSCDKTLGLQKSSNENTSTCDCMPGWFSLTSENFTFQRIEHTNTTMCAKCSSLKVLEPARFNADRSEGKDFFWSQEGLCPGGPVNLAPVCPLGGLWINALYTPNDFDSNLIGLGDEKEQARMENWGHLFPCEGEEQCTPAEGNPITNANCVYMDATLGGPVGEYFGGTRPANGEQTTAICGDGFEGFLCAHCSNGLVKVAGKCVVCSAIDWQVVMLAIAVAMVVAAGMLAASIQTVCPATEAAEVFSAVDVDGNGTLDSSNIILLMKKMGHPKLGVEDPDLLMEQMTGIEDKGAEVTLEQFTAWCACNQPTAAMATLIFFAQTAAMISRHNGVVGRYFGLLNLDVQRVTNSCLGPDLPVLSKLLLVILSPICSIVFVTFLYAILRRGKWLSLQPHHHKRALLNIGLLAFAPVVRCCLEFLICRDIPFPNEDSSYLGTDLAIACWQGQHWLTASFAGAMLLMSILIPVIMTVRVRKVLLSGNSALRPSHWDVVYRTVCPHAFWWYTFMLVVKLCVVALFEFGQYWDVDWGLNMQTLLLVCSLVAHRTKPFITEHDNLAQVTVFLSLAVIVGILNLYGSVKGQGFGRVQGWTKEDCPLEYDLFQQVVHCQRILVFTTFVIVSTLWVILRVVLFSLIAPKRAARSAGQAYLQGLERAMLGDTTLSLMTRCEATLARMFHCIDAETGSRGRISLRDFGRWWLRRQVLCNRNLDALQIPRLTITRTLWEAEAVEPTHKGFEGLNRSEFMAVVTKLSQSDWKQAIDQSRQRAYWVNKLTKKSQWDPPNTEKCLKTFLGVGGESTMLAQNPQAKQAISINNVAEALALMSPAPVTGMGGAAPPSLPNAVFLDGVSWRPHALLDRAVGIFGGGANESDAARQPQEMPQPPPPATTRPVALSGGKLGVMEQAPEESRGGVAPAHTLNVDAVTWRPHAQAVAALKAFVQTPAAKERAAAERRSREATTIEENPLAASNTTVETAESVTWKSHALAAHGALSAFGGGKTTPSGDGNSAHPPQETAQTFEIEVPETLTITEDNRALDSSPNKTVSDKHSRDEQHAKKLVLPDGEKFVVQTPAAKERAAAERRSREATTIEENPLAASNTIVETAESVTWKSHALAAHGALSAFGGGKTTPSGDGNSAHPPQETAQTFEIEVPETLTITEDNRALDSSPNKTVSDKHSRDEQHAKKLVLPGGEKFVSHIPSWQSHAMAARAFVCPAAAVDSSVFEIEQPDEPPPPVAPARPQSAAATWRPHAMAIRALSGSTKKREVRRQAVEQVEEEGEENPVWM